MRGKLILADGSVFSGELLNNMKATGEVVFNTGMTGYQEILTDPSYCCQIVTMTYPLIGNYGTADRFMQSRKSFVNGFVVSELCSEGSSCHKTGELADFIMRQGVPCLYGVDTRAVTRRIRSAGTMKGIIVAADTPQSEIDELLAVPMQKNVVAKATTPKCYYVPATDGNENAPHVAVMDYGIKQNIINSLLKIGCRLTVLPAFTTPDEILALNPQGIFLSNGPGDPKDVMEIVENIRVLFKRAANLPIFGICLGHQLLSLAYGADTYKLKFGHRGSNQPVKNLKTGRIQISSQNHGYAVDAESLKNLPVEITHINVNDGTVEGIRHKELPIVSIQYHPEASPGPDDNVYLFHQFNDMLRRS